jgi:hypothetical protein
LARWRGLLLDGRTLRALERIIERDRQHLLLLVVRLGLQPLLHLSAEMHE